MMQETHPFRQSFTTTSSSHPRPQPGIYTSGKMFRNPYFSESSELSSHPKELPSHVMLCLVTIISSVSIRPEEWTGAQEQNKDSLFRSQF